MKLRPWLELTRASNLPTVWSNVVTGATVAATATGGWTPTPERLTKLVTIVIAASLLYCFGMAHNDVRDSDRDLTARPGKPIPSQRLARRAARAFAYICLVLGVVLAAIVSLQAFYAALLIGFCATLYNREHQKHASSVLWMGLCRGLLYALGAFSTGLEHAPVLFWPTLSLAGYAAHVTLLARAESRPDHHLSRWSAYPLPMWGLFTLLSIADGLASFYTVGWLLFAFWVTYATRIAMRGFLVRGVMAWIAGMSLLDLAVIAWSGQVWMMLVPIGSFAATTFAHRRILGS
ncbi:MAG: UbiA family prenyltransferase [Planctomycetota bacterium]